MGPGALLRNWARRHPDLAELGSGVAAALGVLAISLTQWGVTLEGWARGVTLGAFLGGIVALAYRRRRRLDEQRARAASERRLELARELHDAVAGQVSIVGLQAAAARRVIAERPDQAAEALEVIEHAARAANADLRRMLAALRARSDDDSEVASDQAPRSLRDLPDLTTEYRAAGLAVSLDGLDGIPPLPAAVGAAAYRIIQEALANALGHAGQVPVAVAVRAQDGALAVSIVNEPGRPAEPHRGSGLGVRGMRERAERLGGHLTAGPRPDGGFAVEARIPIARP